jgi:hypothetical protein
MKQAVLIISLSNLLALSAGAQTLSQWNFNDTAGTDLGSAVDSIGSATFSGNLGGGGTWDTNGSGQLTGLGRIGNADIADQTTGIYQFDLTGVTLTSFSGGTDDTVAFGIRSFSSGNNTGFNGDGASSSNIAVIVFGNENDSGGLDMEIIDNNASVGTVTDATTDFTGTFDFRITLDLDSNAANYYWQRNGGGYNTIVSQQFNNPASLNFLFLASNGFGADASIDTATWSAVPEPSTYALFAGGLALLSIMIRRRR